jgi:ASC-1-like (ASCH) protein
MIEIKKQSKPLTELKEGDTLSVNGKQMKVDKQFVLQTYDTMKEMIIEIFNPENDREYQVRYFDDQIETSIEIYELQEDFQYVRREAKTIEW